ncbi:YggT family protein [uncultured Cetobacterium sp.]|uniref:YggT family protein n=1 Tax=uncultured Cetobacterium sp. TaxID=527638 RepID=UPI0026117991|nr:YggT family protein [uncultured Cetobacterium sp.]
MGLFYRAINLTFEIINILILIRIVISWLAPYSRNDFTNFVYSVTEPILKPFRTLIPLGNSRIDLSPLLAYFALKIVRYIIFYLL